MENLEKIIRMNESGSVLAKMEQDKLLMEKYQKE